MIKITLATLLVASTLLATDGYEVYKTKCASCHVEMMEKKAVLKKFKSLKAPPMIEVANRLKENIIIKDDDDDIHRYLVTLFIKNYIINPQLANTMCHAGAIERFKVMPTLKGKITAVEAEAVAEWIYDRYEDIEFK